MRVLELSWEYPPEIVGGLGRHVGMLSRALVAQGVGVDVLTRGSEAAPATAEVAHPGLTVHRVPRPPFPRDVDAFLGWVADMNAALRARAGELRGRVDLVHSHDWLVADAGRAIARRAGVPWLVTVHATEHGRHQGRVSRPPQSTIHAAERAMATGADHVVTCSDWMRGHVAEALEIPRSKISVLPNGIAAGDPEPDVTELASLRARLTPDGERLVLLVGRLVYEKGFDVALDALAPIVHERDDVRWLVAGAGPAEAELRAQTRRLGLDARGRFLGWVDDMTPRSLYRIADLCLIPSRYEPFGIVALEAMAGGCPCVVSDVGGLRELVPGDETVGLRVGPEDPEALRAAVVRLLDDGRLHARIRARARDHAARFDWPRVAIATRGVYAGMLARAPTAA